MTPEQKLELRTRVFNFSVTSDSAFDAACEFVESLIAAERAATVERCAKLFDGYSYGPYAHPSGLIRGLPHALPKDANG